MAIAAGASQGTANMTVSIVVSVAVLVLILYRQLQPRRTSPRLTLPVVLIVLGVASLTGVGGIGGGSGGSGSGAGTLTAGRLGILIALLVLDAGGLGAVRAYTVKLWRDGQQGVIRQGTWVTIALWVAGLAIHEAVDILAHIPSSSALLYLGVTLLAQQAVLQIRVNSLEQQPLGQPAVPVPVPGVQPPPGAGPGTPGPGTPGPGAPGPATPGPGA